MEGQKRGWHTALLIALQAGHINNARKLIEFNSEVAYDMNNDNETILHALCYSRGFVDSNSIHMHISLAIILYDWRSKVDFCNDFICLSSPQFYNIVGSYSDQHISFMIQANAFSVDVHSSEGLVFLESSQLWINALERILKHNRQLMLQFGPSGGTILHRMTYGPLHDKNTARKLRKLLAPV
ncbi:LOW QUALITY PROTEIN: hypothetical protein Cgig2_019021 [Carnegiea gigantea]|uniref:Uncharacterized protein n=1 Tax=Carnegiea gigantea TaxID=171969 RepID=A0A9Q1Q4A4_9CARY|nr:LOW QUALITY PROTEIN: hypothetical protein Cgig2_019021 [Carnegiea gigantea]